jgi:hypothetical protein
MAGSEFSRFITSPLPPPSYGIMTNLSSSSGSPAAFAKASFENIAGHIYLAAISFTTYSNSYRGNPSGAIVFPYQGIYRAREFYQPDYVNNNSKIADNRTTIYWNPEIKTDSTGKARVSFYNSDLKGKALIRISGVSYSLKDASTSVSHYLSQ